jgi:DNA modification methylase
VKREDIGSGGLLETLAIQHESPRSELGRGRAPSTAKRCAQALEGRWTELRNTGPEPRRALSERVTLIQADAACWLSNVADNSIHAVVTDPPYGIIEYNGMNQEKLRAGKGGVWRIPPSFDGAKRGPLPRFTVLSAQDRFDLVHFFRVLATDLARVLVPGGHIFMASNPLLSSQAFAAFESVGLEKRGEVIRLVQTLRGGDRPKGAEAEFAGISVMARSCWEPWGVFRKPLEGTVATNLRKWGTGGLRRISATEPFKDLIPCSPTRGKERKIAPHPSLKPQRFLRQLVRAALPLGEGIVYDPFAGSGSTLAAAEALGYIAIGTERDKAYFQMGCDAFRDLSKPNFS